MGKLSSLPLTLKRHSWAAIATLASVLGTAYVYLSVTPPRYQTTARLLVEQKGGSVSELGRSLTRLSENVPGGSNPIATQAESVKSQRVLQAAIDQVAMQPVASTQKLTPEKLAKAIKIKIIPATNILELSYQNPNPELAAQILNAIAQTSVQESAESIRREASSVRSFLEARVPEQEALLAAAEAAESRYRQVSGVVAFDAQTTSLVNSLSELEDQLRTAAAQLQETRSRNSQLQRVIGVNNPKVAYAAARVGQDEQLRSLRTRLADLEARVIESSARLGDQHPDLIAIKQQRDETKQTYAERVGQVLDPGQAAPSSNTEATNEVSRDLMSRYIVGEVDSNALVSRLTEIQAERLGLQSRIAELPVKQQNLTALTRKREEAGTTLRQLQNNLEQARIAEAQLISNVRVLDAAIVPATPSLPQPLAVWAAALAAGSILATGVMVLLEAMDNKLRTAEEIEPLVKLPVLANLPKLRPHLSRDRVPSFLNQADLIEPYRMFLKNLDRTDPNLKVLLVSSTVTGEGKSDFVARLGAVAAAMSRRTLIIDADLRDPLQANYFELLASPGLTNAVLNHTPIGNTIQATNVENLAVLTHGDWIERPVMVSESTAIPTLLATAKASFDLIIVDASAVGGCADVMALSQHADRFVLVARPDFTAKEKLKKAVVDLRASGTEILGIVVSHTPDVFNANSPRPMPPKFQGQLNALPSPLSPSLADSKTSLADSKTSLADSKTLMWDKQEHQ
jgi:polysaccharide biosynthesis transport protein